MTQIRQISMAKTKVFEKTSLNKLALLIISCLIVGFLVFLRDIYSVPVNKYIIFLFATISMLFFDKNHIIAFLGFIFSLTYGVPGTYIYVAAAIILLFKDRGRFNIILLIWLFFSFLEFLLSVFNSPVFSVTFYISYISRLFLLFYFLSEQQNNKTDGQIDYSLAVRLYIFGTIIFLIISVLLFLKNGSFNLILSGKIRFGDAKNYYWATDNIEGLLTTTNSNNIAYQSCVALACCVLMFFKKKNTMWVLIYGVIWIGALLTTSQTFLIISLLQILLWIIFLIGKKEKPIYIILFLIIAIVGMVLIVSSGIYRMLINRLENGMFQNDSGRLSLFLSYFRELSSRPINFIFGTGALYYKSVLQLDESCHNGLQQILISYGIIGFIAFISAFFFYANKILGKYNRKKIDILISSLPLISSILFTQTIQFFNPVELMLPFIIGLFALRIVVHNCSKEPGAISIKRALNE